MARRDPGQAEKTLYQDRCHGVTLPELLVAIAILATLAAFIMPGFRHGQQKVIALKCASNLRTVGRILFLYTGEHQGRLPGPLWTTQNASYDLDTRKLGYHLAPYLQLIPAKQTRVLEILQCPGWSRTISGAAGKQWMEGNVPAITGKLVIPFGYPGATPPYRLQDLPDPAKSLLFTELDQRNSPNYAGDVNVPTIPVHGKFRNTLFLDGHVTGEPVK